jgi:hypothetical protein
VRAVCAIAIVAASVACVPSDTSGPWSADSGIYGTYEHFGNPPSGPPSFICGIGYDVRYHGIEAIADLDVVVRFPSAFLARAIGSRDLSGWQHATVPSAGPGSLAEAARLGHASGTAGAVCPSGAVDLETLRGTVLRLEWRSSSGAHEQMFTITDVRGNMRVFAGELSPDGQLRIEWER